LALAISAVLLTGAQAEVVQHGHFRVAVDARLAPKRLPRSGLAPVRFSLGARFLASHGKDPPQLRRIKIEINRHGHLSSRGLPRCRIDQIQPSTTANAIDACGDSLVGEGYLSSKVRFTQQAPFPSEGRVMAFNGIWRNRPAILAHIYGAKPAPTSYTIPFLISGAGRGQYGSMLTASLPQFSSRWGYVTSLSLLLGRRFVRGGTLHSYLTAGCPAPPGFNIVNFPLFRTSFSFAGHGKVQTTLIRSCRARA
jgi:hypothetical protein